MRKLILSVAVSVDGFTEGPNGAYDRCVIDSDYSFEAFLNVSMLFLSDEKHMR